MQVHARPRVCTLRGGTRTLHLHFRSRSVIVRDKVHGRLRARLHVRATDVDADKVADKLPTGVTESDCLIVSVSCLCAP